MKKRRGKRKRENFGTVSCLREFCLLLAAAEKQREKCCNIICVPVDLLLCMVIDSSYGT